MTEVRKFSGFSHKFFLCIEILVKYKVLEDFPTIIDAFSVNLFQQIIMLNSLRYHKVINIYLINYLTIL